jgi:S1-C subfamily serine protease
VKLDRRGVIQAMLPCVVLFCSTEAYSQIRITSYSNGTGFYVSKEGHIVTNAHVIRQCISKVQVHSASVTSEAEIIARDDANDLALLKSTSYAPEVAQLRASNSPLRTGEPVIVMGYGGLAGADGTYSFVKSTLLDTKGPIGESNWIQFADAAQKGNSGGPLLDESGHVIGVITGKTQLFKVDARANVAPTQVGNSDVAVNLATLTGFLGNAGVRMQDSASGLIQFSDNRLESTARNFIVQLKCETP